MALVVHPRCKFGVWRQAEDSTWELWLPTDRGLDFSRSQGAKPSSCDCGLPLVEQADGSLAPLMVR